MTVKERLVKYIECKGISMNALEQSIGASSGALRKSKNISSEIISTILGMYSDLNPQWLLTGEGSMLNGSGGNVINITKQQGTNNASDGSTINVSNSEVSLLHERIKMLEQQTAQQNKLIEQQSKIIEQLSSNK